MNTKLQEKTVSNAPNNNQKSQGMNMSFYEKKRQQLQKQHEERKRGQQLKQEALKKSKKINNQKNEIQNTPNKKSQKNISNTQSKVSQPLCQIHKVPQSIKIQNQAIEPQITKKKISVQEILRDGRIVKVIERTLTFDEYKVQCLYDGQIMELIASKDEIIRNNIIPLLDFYQKILGLR